MNKRIISLALVFCVLLTIASFGSVAQAQKDYTKAVELLDGLDIYHTENGNKAITRGEFAQMVSNILNHNMPPAVTNGHFGDVTAADSFSGAVYNLAQRGIISGYDATSFRPDEPVLLEQAVKILLSAMGYDTYIKAQGGAYPAHYITLATSNDLFEGISCAIGESMTGYEAIQLVANALEMPMFAQTGYGDSESFAIRENYTMTTEFLKLEKIEGVITDNGITALTGNSAVKSGNVVINGIEYWSGASNAEELLGYAVEAYATNQGNSKETIVFARPGARVNAMAVKADRLSTGDSDFSDTNIVFTDIYGNEDELEILKGADFIYNGKAYTNLRANDLKITAGELILLDNNNDGVFEVVFVYAPTINVVSTTNVGAQEIYVKGSKLPILLGEAKDVKIIKDGKNADLSAINEWDVVMVYKSKDGQLITIDVYSEKVSGTVDSFTKTSHTIGIDGEYYHVSDDSVFDEVVLGKIYEFCVDGERNIVAVKEISSKGNSVAYFVDAVSLGGLFGGLEVKLFTANGIHVVYSCAQKVSVNGDNSMTHEELEIHLKDNASRKLVIYRLNAEGKISEINLPFVGAELPSDRSGDLHLYHDQGGEEINYYSPGRTFNGKVVMSPSVKIIQVPLTDGAPDNEYSVNGLNYFKNTSKYKNFVAYNFGDEDARADYILHFAEAKSEYGYPVVVSSIKKVLTSDGENRECITGFTTSGAVEYTSAEEKTFSSKKIAIGDIVRCALNINGEVADVIRNFDGTQKVVDDTTKIVTSMPYNPDSGFVGDVYHNYDGLIGLTTLDMTQSTATAIKNSLLLTDVSASKIYVFDETGYRPEVIVGNAGLVYDYLKTGKGYSTVFVNFSESRPVMVVVYQKGNAQ
ncbi:MAG: S-layer homology domain-containing protein [Ruminococcaceae bacterium]|nr:S-layer homology domain-containing protein [Oscillospiraceae bacterium]